MRDYHTYGEVSLGSSDVATVILAGMKPRGVGTMTLHFGGDGHYGAYLVNENAEIGSHYKLKGIFRSWLKVYDDDSLMVYLRAKKIKVYRAGEYGCIIQVFGKVDLVHYVPKGDQSLQG